MKCQHCGEIIVALWAFEAMAAFRQREWEFMRDEHEKKCPLRKD